MDFVEIIAGTEGSGKSTFAIFKMIRFLILAKQEDHEVNEYQLQLFENEQWEDLMREYVFLSGKQFLRAIADNPKKYKRAIIIIDEAGRELFCRDSQNKINKLLVKFFITARFLNNIYLLCVPKPKYLDVYLREERSFLISWVLLKVNFEKHYKFLTSSRELLSVPRLAFQYLLEKYDWRGLLMRILKLELDQIEEDLQSWRSAIPITGRYQIPHNLPYQIYPNSPATSISILSAYENLKKDSGFLDFITEVEEKLEED